MKRFLYLLLLASSLVHAQSKLNELADVSSNAAALSANGAMPADYPAYIYVQRVPLGSGTPVPGVSSGYDRAEPVTGGLYHVPGYLPFDPTPTPVPARVVQLACVQRDGNWLCDGYSINPGITRGENILIQPVFKR